MQVRTWRSSIAAREPGVGGELGMDGPQNVAVRRLPQTLWYGEIPFLISNTISAASSALFASKSYLLVSVDLYTTT